MKKNDTPTIPGEARSRRLWKRVWARRMLAWNANTASAAKNRSPVSPSRRARVPDEDGAERPSVVASMSPPLRRTAMPPSLFNAAGGDPLRDRASTLGLAPVGGWCERADREQEVRRRGE